MREHPRRSRFRRLQVIREVEPAEALVAMHEPDTGTLPPLELGPVVSRETTAEVSEGPEVRGRLDGQAIVAVGPFVAGGQVPPDFSAVAALQEAPPALSPARRLKLEALTAAWVRDVREGGPGPDDTILYAGPSSSLPPVPPPAARPPLEVPAPGSASLAPTRPAPADTVKGPPLDPAATVVDHHPAEPARVSAWTSRHDPRSLEYAVRARLAAPVPIQDVVLAVGPILDQGTTPPLTRRDASACTGMAAVAARNVLELEAAPGGRSADLLDEAAAVMAYRRAQDLDHVSGHDYAGTSVLAVMKYGQEAGWWDTYLWALKGTRDLAQALLQLRAPIVVGVPWSAGLEAPDAAGIATPGGRDLGGHSLAVVGLLQAVAGRRGPWFVLQQSRGLSEGVGGLIYVHHAHLQRLLAHAGEAAVPLRDRVAGW